MKNRKKDNDGFIRKRQLRVNLMREIPAPLVLETHAGFGRLYRHIYAGVPFGIAIDKQADRAARCAQDRPTWAVYEGDSEEGLREGLAGRWPVNFVDVDPYGDPWPTLEAFFTSERERPDRLGVAVTDGLRQSAKMGIAWRVASLREVVERFGNASIHDNYLVVCEQLLIALAERAGYRVSKWTGYYTGHSLQMMTHFGGILERGAGVAVKPRRRRSAAP